MTEAIIFFGMAALMLMMHKKHEAEKVAAYMADLKRRGMR